MKPEHACFTTHGDTEPVLQSVHARGRLEGLLLSMTLTQVFRNPSRQNLETTYTFPLAFGAVLTSLSVSLNGKRRVGVVNAKAEGRRQYEAAIESGDAPVLVERQREGTYTVSLGSLAPDEEAVVEISYAQLLSYDQDRIRLVIPTTIAPRYGDAQAQGGLSPEQAPGVDLLAQYPFGVEIEILGNTAQLTTQCATHRILQQPTEQGCRVTLATHAWLDRDFVLTVNDPDSQGFALAGPDPQSGEGHWALIAGVCPRLPEAEAAPLRVKLLVDCSGSMAGDSMKQTRKALRGIASLLGENDVYTYSRFGSNPQRVLGGRRGTPEDLNYLREAIERTEADLGGTEMHVALEDTFRIRFTEDMRGPGADVLLITDGDVWDAQRLVDAARRSGHRIHALGVGSAPAESLLREMAEASGGSCEMVTPAQDMRVAVQRLLTRMRCALSVETRLELGSAPLWAAPLPNRVVPGETVHACARLAAQPDKPPAFCFNSNRITPPQLQLRTDDLVARLVAARQIASLGESEQTLELAQRYQLVTDETALVLVVEREAGDKTDGMPNLHRVDHMMAAGWGGTGEVSALYDIRCSAQRSFSYDNNVPSVWRTRRPSSEQMDLLASGNMEDYEIPAFLRRQSDDAASSSKIEPSGYLSKVARFLGFPDKRPFATSDQIIAIFNAAIARGLNIRLAMRRVTDLNIDPQLTRLIAQAAREVGSPLKAWAAHLLWLHERTDTAGMLSAGSLALVHNHLQEADPAAITRARELFDTNEEDKSLVA